MDTRILQFWNWFVHNEAIFRDKTQAEKAQEMLNNQVLTFGKFAWGIDEGQQKPYVFTISPNNDRQLYKISQQLIKYAPSLANWDFRSCKPPIKDWDFKFQAYNNFFLLDTYDAAKWHFVLIEEEDYRVSIEIKANNIVNLDREDQVIAAQRVVTNILGEQLYIEEVYGVNIVPEFDPRDKDWIYSLSELRKRFLYFIE